ncbi:type II secretion system protein GspC [Veronia nyctiphanis]|uniref:Type II secretion system protein GspC n=1 Tax=Veronia nyctiphanis TaxID=1278244 RepID=A0A4Q0YNV3_9GAMM|nr:type II secretion system protein GspC [Veronia nyctiphanis]RXJ72657.1 type II secretion system protein GspC [Veronia nyctiphanis]
MLAAKGSNFFSEVDNKVNEKAVKKLASLVTLILLIVFAWILGRIVWQFWQPQSEAFVAAPASVSVNVQPADESYRLRDILEQNLFGRYSQQASKPVVKPVNTNAPKTKLNLKLVGVSSSSEEASGLAIIANRGAQAVYGIGEAIQGTRATLRRVFPDRVIIRNNGRDELLFLDGVDDKQASRSQRTAARTAPSRQSSKATSASRSEVDVSSIRAEILSNPQALLKHISLSQAQDETGLLGYRVGPGSDRRLFDSSGLEEGDIATEINGNDLRNPAEVGQIWQSLADSSEISITVLRDGQQHVVYISL